MFCAHNVPNQHLKHTHAYIARAELRNAVEDGQRLCRRHCVPSLALFQSSISTFKMNGAQSEAGDFWSLKLNITNPILCSTARLLEKKLLL